MIPNLKAKSEEMDREIERLTQVLADERVQTNDVARNLRVKLRYNAVVTRAYQVATGLPSDPVIPLPERK